MVRSWIHLPSPLTNNGPGGVVNVFEAVDVISLIKGGVYDDLNLTVGEALLKRSEVIYSTVSMQRIMADMILGFPWHFHVYPQRPPGFHLRHNSQISRSSLCCN